LKTKYLLIFVNALILGFIGCAINQQIDSTSVKPDDLLNADSTWEKIRLPFDAQVLAEHNEKIIVLGEEGTFAQIGKHKKVKSFHSFNTVDSFVSKDGGLTIEKDNINKSETPYLCLPAKADLLSDEIYVFSRCDHLRQISVVDISSNEPSRRLLTFIFPENFNRDSDTARVVPYRPTDLVETQNQILFPAVTPNGIALLIANKQDGEFDVFWQKKEQGQILGIDFIGNEGWMILVDGTIMHSLDGGKNWLYLSKVSDADFVIYDVKFKNSLDGYLVGNNGIVLKTSNGGKTWEKEIIDATQTLSKIVIEKDFTLVSNILGDAIYFNRDGKWRPLNLPNDKGVDDILLKDGYIHILIGNELFQRQIKGIK